MGEDVLYSGTVAAAMEGAILGIPALAMSLASWKHPDFSVAAGVAAELAAVLLARDLPARFLLNVNIPPVSQEALRGRRVTQLGNRVYNDVIIKKMDPRGRAYYWIGGGEPSWTPSVESDFAAVSEGWVSITPLLMNLTDQDQVQFLREMELERP